MTSRLLNSGYVNEVEDASRIVFSSGSRHYIFDTMDRMYFDLGLGSGSLIYGHANPAILTAMSKALERGCLLPSPTAEGSAVASRLSECLPEGLTNFVFCNSGSEATQRALRYARGYSERDLIVSFAGGWHGMNEWTLFGGGDRFLDSISRVDGIPSSALRCSKCIEFNSVESLDWLEKNGDRCGGIIVEPIQGSNPQNNARDFLSSVKEISIRHNIPLIFDEIISGFRVSLGGASELLGIEPDICTYGKALGAGLPVGLVALNEKIFAKTFGAPEKTTLTGGTFSANPLILSVVKWVLQHLQQADYDMLSTVGNDFRQSLNQVFANNGIEMKMIGVGSFNRLCFTNQDFLNRTQRDFLEANSQVSKHKFITALLKRGVFCPANFLIFNSFDQTPADFEKITPLIVESAMDSYI